MQKARGNQESFKEMEQGNVREVSGQNPRSNPENYGDSRMRPNHNLFIVLILFSFVVC